MASLHPSRLNRLALFSLAAAGLLALVFALLLSPLPPALEANSPPATPASVTVTRSGNTLNVTYDNPAGATKYHVTYSSDNGNSWASAGDNLTAGGVTFGGTDPTKTYIAAVRAGNQYGWSGWRNSAPIAPDGSTAPPAAPGTIGISRTDGTLTASWTEVASATEYHVTYSSNNGGSWSAPSCGDNCSNAVTISVDNAKTYIVAVRAGNDSGWSGWTQSDASGPFGPQTPATPGPITVTRTDGQLTATWDAVSGANYYHINYSTDNKNSWQTYSSSYNQTTISRSADNSKTYYVAVRAGTATSNDTLWSGWRTSDASAPIGQPPATPASVSVSRGNGTLSVSGYGVADANKYHVNYSSDGGKSWTAASDNHTGTNITISNVDNALPYIVAVRAGNNGGWSGWRNSAAIGPSQPPPAPASVTVIRVCDSRFEVAWPAVSGATGYDVNFSTNSGKSWKRTLSNVTVLAWKFNQWSKNKTYILAVRARNSAGEGGWTNSAAFPPPPCRPDTLSAVTSTTHGTAGGSITATWSAGKRATAYNVNYRPPGGQWQRIQTGVTGTTHTGTVSSAGSYTVSVQSTHGHGMSQWRSGGVSWLTAGGITATGATLTLAGHSGNWYVKETSPATNGSCSSAISGNAHTLTTLSAGQTYTYTVYSDSSCATKMAAATFTTPTPAVTLTASSVTGTGATLTIANHSGNWYYKADAAPDNTCKGPVSGTSKTLSGLTTGTTYTYTAYSDSSCATMLATAAAFTPLTDFDSDDDGLIEVSSLAQLNAMRWDLDGDGTASSGNTTSYAAAFPNAKSNMGCNDDEVSPSACSGYELSANLDFDTNGNDTADSGDPYWNNGAGWSPIGGWSSHFTGTFDGNGNKLSNLHVSASTTADDATPDIGGLFGRIGKGGAVEDLGLEDVSVTVSSTQENEIFAGALAADNRGTVTGVWSSGSVTASSQRDSSVAWVQAAGLVGRNDRGGSGNDAYEGVIRASYSTAAVTSKGVSGAISVEGDARAGGLVAVNKGTIAASYATGNLRAETSVTNRTLSKGRAGGLVAINNGGTIIASYATGNVSSNATKTWHGGLVGRNNNGTITASYATGTVGASGPNKNNGGLVGTNEGSSTVTASYWDTTTSNKTTSPAGTGKTTSELQTPTGYTGIYANWNVNVDGVTGNDDPWDFGTSSQYPTLK